MTPAWAESLLFGLTLFFMLLGLFALVVPLFPGTVVMVIAALLYGLGNGFGALGGILFAIMVILMVTAEVLDNVLKGAGARWGGASWKALGLAILAGFAGTIFLPPFGGLIGAPLAILIYEYTRQRDWKKAFNALKGLAVGYGAAYFVRLVLGLGILILWLVWVWKG